MHFFPNRNRPRSTFDIRVGRYHLAEITVHLITHRRDAAHRKRLQKHKIAARKNSKKTEYADEWDWYDTNRVEINAEFLELLQSTVLSRMFGKEIEDYYRKKHPTAVPAEDEDIGGVASKNKTQRKRKGAAGKKQPKTKHQKKGLAAVAASRALDEEAVDKKPEKDVYFAFGEWIQLAYKKEPIKDKSSASLFFKSNEPDAESTVSAKKNDRKVKQQQQEVVEFYDKKKLSHRLMVWVGRSDAAAASDGGDASTAGPGEGLYRPEMIPISELFCTPKEFMDLSDDEDD